MDEGLELVDFTDETTARLVEILPDFASANNPLDVTGYVLLDRTLLGRAMEVVVADPNVDVTMLLSELPRAVPPDLDGAVEMWRANAGRISKASTPVVPVSTCLTDINEVGREIRQRSGFPLVLGGIEHAMTAIGNAVRYPELVRTAGEPPVPPLEPFDPVDAERTGVWGEQRAAEQLRRAGVPVVPTHTVDSAEAAVRAADDIGYPVVLKIAGDEIAHKSDIGGVRLALADAAAVRAAYDEMMTSVQAAGVSSSTALVQPMRAPGTELLVGVVRDPVWGLTLAIALGGVWVELMDDSVLRVLPVSLAAIRGALEKLRGIDVLKGSRGARPVELDALVAVIGRIVALAQALGDGLESLEINPLRVCGGEIEALDALITWR